MGSLFFDTSALAKRYVYETGSEWISGFFDEEAKESIYIAEITTVELTSAVVRRSNTGSIPRADVSSILASFDRHLLTDYFVLEMTSEVLLDARSIIRKHGLRSYDAVQLAIAEKFNLNKIEAGESIVTFVSADIDLLSAANSDGLLTEKNKRPH